MRDETATLIGGPYDGAKVPVVGHFWRRLLTTRTGQWASIIEARYLWELRDGGFVGVFSGLYRMGRRFTGREEKALLKRIGSQVVSDGAVA